MPPASSPARDLLQNLPGAVQRGSALAERCREERFHPTGDAVLDAGIGGGLPVGRCHEIYGGLSSGVTSLSLRMLAERTRRGHCVAWVEVADALDPASCRAHGVRLEQLLWVRAQGRAQALRAAEAILSAAGFALVVLDLRPGSGRQGRERVPAAARWVRLSRMAAGRRSSLLLLPGATPLLRGVPAAVRLRLQEGRARRAEGTPLVLEGICTRAWVERAPAGARATGRSLPLVLS